MALPIVAFFSGQDVQTQIRRNAEWDEYIVEFWHRDNVQGRFAHRPQADYHTSDKQDAWSTAENSAK